MNATAKSIFKKVGIALLVILFLCTIAVPGHGPQRMGYETMSRRNMEQLFAAVRMYDSDEGRLPSGLADIMPMYYDYSAAGNLLYFKSPYSNTSKPDDKIAANPDVIKAYSAYLLIPLKGENFVISERPGMWKSGTVGFVQTCENEKGGLKSVYRRVSEDEFQKLVANGFSSGEGTTSPSASK